jgi:magnesium transporter
MNTIQNDLSYVELQDAWPLLVPGERLEAFRLLAQADADDFFLSLSARDQVELLFALPERERRLWMRLLAPDDAADVIQEVPQEARPGLLALLDEVSRAEVSALLDYAEDEAGGLMNPRYARLRPDMYVDEAIGYLRRQARERIATIYYVYVLDEQQRLVGIISFRELFATSGDKKVQDFCRTLCQSRVV